MSKNAKSPTPEIANSQTSYCAVCTKNDLPEVWTTNEDEAWKRANDHRTQHKRGHITDVIEKRS